MINIDIFKEIQALVNYGIKCGFIEIEDEIYSINKILEVLKLDDFKCYQGDVEEDRDLDGILENILAWSIKEGLINDTVTEKDILDTKIMATMIPKPSQVIKEFLSNYEINPKKATDYYYDFSKKSNYIRVERVKKDLKWKVATEYGDLDITINMAKPEKDPKEIAKAKTIKSSNYPKCLLCKENEGYAGHFNHPARGNHRIIPLVLNNSRWFLQYSPYVYFNEHSIVLKDEHSPMRIGRDTFVELLDFIETFNHYFIGSNADLPIVGGSILTHNHYQGGNYEFAMEKAESEKQYIIKDFEDIIVSKVKWPLSAIRIACEDKDRLVELATKINNSWKKYSDEEVDILAFTGETEHNTVTPIARFRNGKFELDLVFRNNRTTSEYPFGIFHPHEELHHIKKENIGLIEVMGLAVLPSRLKYEMEELKSYVLKTIRGEMVQVSESIKKHIAWINEVIINHGDITEENIDKVIEEEIGKVFLKVLEDCGVFKRDAKGIKAFDKFMNLLN
ncbi:UTP-hexose-1-phosphate uridylyltransferase [Clostridium cavendishii DSM 21758]|uniref:Galactose-1-phosphate uridylyltransferase n=1 Tax=Clostridium cavendishii DSM 21758 TaxID=1121302 RepID=A0A1M6BNS5_9CLOT|nr:UDP-glucose--hexose-1-phosphate uridylyltransferase [Clostridium cavendishii]SHI50317.1 UTP-hexose-1-phosphate uridylyltransferase [Clostridium cavendishii DSM 21758]